MSVATGIVMREWDSSFYADSEATQPIESIDVGEVWEGEVKEDVIYIRNNEPTLVRDIEFELNKRDATIEGPEVMLPHQVAPITIRWNPDEASIALKGDIEISATLVYR